jgi:aminomethyltransferase
MGEVVVRGSGASEATDRLLTNATHKAASGRAVYALMCRPDGGIVDDLIVYKVSDEEVFICVNAANRAKDFAWIAEHMPRGVSATDEGDSWAQIALQGPAAPAVLSRWLGSDAATGMRPFRFIDIKRDSVPLRIATTGYTGAGGYELYVPAEHGLTVWEGLLEAGAPEGIRPIGLGARDTLRLEMGFPLYGNDISDTTTPLEAQLDRWVKLDKPDFIGKDALVRQKQAGIERALVGFVVTGRGIARPHYPILIDGEPRGEVTSGTRSPSLEVPIGMGYVPVTHADEGTAIAIEVRGKAIEARVTRPPFLPQGD